MAIADEDFDVWFENFVFTFADVLQDVEAPSGFGVPDRERDGNDADAGLVIPEGGNAPVQIVVDEYVAAVNDGSALAVPTEVYSGSNVPKAEKDAGSSSAVPNDIAVVPKVEMVRGGSDDLNESVAPPNSHGNFCIWLYFSSHTIS